MVRLDGADGDFIYFSAESRSREEPHTVIICKRTGIISCTCEDCTYRKKQSHILYPVDMCFHCRAVLHVAKLLNFFGGNE